MNIWDYVLVEDVLSLTDEEYESFRNYMRFLGFRVKQQFGSKSVGHRYNELMLYDDGDLAWSKTENTTDAGGNRIPLEEVKRMAALGMLV